ncbi:MAG: hypothetical protein EPN21_04515 [Methylococcaceae bacterium]|nr:MAG: hypothetical protein EPN21_04515 [Methylococcaceae bacterium]
MRPRAISLLCILLTIWESSMLLWALSLFIHVSDKAEVFFLLSSLGVLLSLGGLWLMRRWGVYLFLALWVISLFTQYSAFNLAENHLTSTFNWLMLAIYLIVILPYWKLFGLPRQG